MVRSFCMQGWAIPETSCFFSSKAKSQTSLSDYTTSLEEDVSKKAGGTLNLLSLLCGQHRGRYSVALYFFCLTVLMASTAR